MCSSLGFKDVGGLQGSSSSPGLQVQLHRSGLADPSSCPRTCQAPGRIQTAEMVPERSSLRSAVPGDPTVEGGRVKGVGGVGSGGVAALGDVEREISPPTAPAPATDPLMHAIGSQGLLVRDASASLLLCSKLCKTSSSSSCCLARTFKALFF